MRKRVLPLVLALLITVTGFEALPVFAAEEAPVPADQITEETAVPAEEPAAEEAEETQPAEEPAAPEEEPAAVVTEDPEEPAVQTGWVDEEGGRRFYYEEGGYYKGEIQDIDGAKYCFDDNGFVKHWLFQFGDKTYYANGEGVLQTSRFVQIGSTGKAYYFGEDSAAVTGLFKASNGELYYADAAAVVRTDAGLITVDGDQYYVQKGGVICRDTKKTIGSKQYVFGPNGAAKKWLFTWDGHTYYANGNGELAVNKLMTMSNTGARYYFGADGAAKTGFFDVGSKRYYAFNSGVIRKWLFTEGGHTYYANSNGELAVSKMMTVGGTKYYFNKYGAAIMGVFKLGDAYYYANSKGEIKTTTGWVTFKNKKYYVKSTSGKLAACEVISVGGNKYLMKYNAEMITGVGHLNGVYYYCYPNSGIIKTTPGRINHNGKLYIAKTGGTLYRNQFIVTKDCAYYADSNAQIKTSKFTYKDAFNNMVLTPNSEGQIPLSQYKKLNMTGAPPAISMSPYVLIDIGDQKIYLYKGGKCILSSSIVSGRIYGKKYHGTPPGTYHLLYKQRDRYLEGFEDDGVTRYKTHVWYWMPFRSDGYGMHDAPWRTAFGGKIYQYHGSHGCVNLPNNTAKTVYSTLRAGDMVKVQP